MLFRMHSELGEVVKMVNKKPKPKNDIDTRVNGAFEMKLKRKRHVDVVIDDILQIVSTSAGAMFMNRLPKDPHGVKAKKFFTGGMPRLNMKSTGLDGIAEKDRDQEKQYLTYLEKLEEKQFELKTMAIQQIKTNAGEEVKTIEPKFETTNIEIKPEETKDS